MRYVCYTLVILMFILHQDWWLWNDSTLLFGFMPIGLAYHGLFSIMASVTWGLTLYFCWPTHIEEFADGKDEGNSQPQ